MRLFLQEPAWKKWWAAEVRFTRRLTRRHRRILDGLWWPGTGHVGQYGVVWEQWPNKWPGDDSRGTDEDTEMLLQAIQRIGYPARIRVAPYGRDCPGHWRDEPLCPLGGSFACHPVFDASDWIHYDPRAL